MAKQNNSITSEAATVIKIGTILRDNSGDSIVTDVLVVQQQDTGLWKTLLVIDLCLENIPDLAPSQVYLDELIRSMKRKTIIPIDPPKTSKTKKR